MPKTAEAQTHSDHERLVASARRLLQAVIAATHDQCRSITLAAGYRYAGGARLANAEKRAISVCIGAGKPVAHTLLEIEPARASG
jgi:hypothetical protein